MKRAVIILSAFILAVFFSMAGFAKDNNNGGSIYYDGNGNVGDSQFTNNTSETDRTIYYYP